MSDSAEKEPSIEAKWLHLELRCSPAEPGHEIAAAWLSEVGFSMFETDVQGLHAYGLKAEVDIAEMEEVGEKLAALGCEHWAISEVQEKNWNAEWEQAYEPVVVSEQLRVRATFHAADPSFGREIVIQPQMAFGTGHHETTRGILAQMEHMDWAGKSVLDMGCGSGVLAIYAKLRGAAPVWAIDIDEWCTRNTQENIALNPLNDGSPADIQVRLGGANQLGAEDVPQFDFLLANINRNILTRDMAAYRKVLKPGATALFSGFFPSDVRTLEQALKPCGMRVVGQHQEGEWCILEVKVEAQAEASI
jgi:ribosomal protein L11 methyltransferase